MLSILGMFNFLQYGTTAQVARAEGAGERVTAARLGAQALWLSFGAGVVLAVLIAWLAVPIVDIVGVKGEAKDFAVTYLRIVTIGVPSAFLTLGGQGFLRGVSDLRTPLLILAMGNVLNAILEVLFVYGFGWGIEGSAWGTAVAQTVMGTGMAVVILRRVGRDHATLRPALARRLLSIGKFIFVRTTALIGAFFLAGAFAARLGDAQLGAYQIAFQLWVFLALVLDSIAIAGQIIVGRELGAGRAESAYAAALRMIWLSTMIGGVMTVTLLALRDVIPRGFSSDTVVLEQCALLWPIFASVEPLSGAVFALDGIMIGASDGPYLALSMAVAFVACAAVLVAAYESGWGVRGVWAALCTLIVMRLALMGSRFLRRRWIVTGWA